MKIGILSRGPKLYSTRRLVEAAKALGCDNIAAFDTVEEALADMEVEENDFEAGPPSLDHSDPSAR